ncbi:major facilitator superfamily domain-containing protein [Aspergillus karnatakaensis]|uniref:major facilitator superfamily domain-containing protein n=1 Tax=Aspergillus karnatakaensis TaxID=1810916 RepID=UPI003CCDF8EA
MTVSEHSPLLNPSADTEEGACEAVNEKQSDTLIIFAAFLGIFIASADESLVISTYSSIASQFHHLSEGSWLLLAYNFGYCLSLPAYGVIGEAYGRKNVLLTSYILFALSCLACGASTSITQLVLSRVLTGISSAGISVVVSVILTSLLPTKDIALYRGYQNSISITGRSLGAPIGGFLADTIGWRWSFYGQVPLVLLCTLFTCYRLPSSMNKSDSQEDLPPMPPTRRSLLRTLDIAGLVSFAGTILVMLFLIQAAGTEDDIISRETILLAFAFLSGVTLLVVIELFWASNPIIPVRMLAQNIGRYWILQVLLLASRFALVSNLVPYLIRAENTSDFMAAIWLVTTSLGVSIGSIVSGLVIKYTKRFKNMTLLSTLLTLAIYTLILLTYPHGFNAAKGILLLIAGFAPGILFPALFVGMSATAPQGTLSVCISTYYLSQQVGSIIGPAVGSALVQRDFKRRLMGVGGLGGSGLSDKDMIINRILNEVRFANGLPGEMRGVVRACFLSAFRALPVFSIVGTVIMIPILASLKEPVLA